jgi:hypothetical protein
VQNYCVIDGTRKDFSTPSKKLYNHYVKVCENDNIRPLDENVFGSRLVEHGVMHKRKRIKKGEGGMQYVYEPIRLKHELQQEQSGLLTANYTAESTHHEEKRDELDQERESIISNSALYVSSGDAPKSSGISDNTNEQPAISYALECPQCALPGNNTPISKASNLRDLQLHIIFRHPEVDFEAVEED